MIRLLSFPGSGSGCSWPTVCCPYVPTAPSYTSFRSQTGKLEHREVKGQLTRCLCQSTFSYVLPIYVKIAWTKGGLKGVPRVYPGLLERVVVMCPSEEWRGWEQNHFWGLLCSNVRAHVCGPISLLMAESLETPAPWSLQLMFLYSGSLFTYMCVT